MGSGFFAFWSTFIGSAILGLEVSHFLDNMWELHYLGHRSYNDMAPLLLAGSLFGAIEVGIIRVVRGGKKTGWKFSTTFGLFSPILVLVGLIVLA